jgi:AcrR family transcriptional regulator
VARWQEGAAGRLQEAALRLYAERGYEQTTVADIASEAGVTARTFFRHYADKREVLFAGSERLLEGMVTALAAAPPAATPVEAVAAALDASSIFLSRDHQHSRMRHAVVSANTELLERELIKMATLSAALADGLRKRGVPNGDASLAAEAGILVLRVAFEQWVTDPDPPDLGGLMKAALARLSEVTAR